MSNVFSGVCTVGADAVVRYSAAGLAILNVRVANNVGFGDKQQTLWIGVTIFGKRAEGALKDYLLKGQQVFVSGELTLNEYKANDGTMKTSLELNANIIDLIGKRNDNAQGAMPQATNRARPATQPTPASADNFDAPYDDDIPF